jgi:PAS domain S-box-containing protein
MSSPTLPAHSEQLFRYLFEQASLGIAVEDLDGKLLLANPALSSILGYGQNELCGMNCSQFANPEDEQDDWALFQQLSAGVIDHYSLEKRYLKKDGAHIWGRLHVSLLKNAGGTSPLVFAFVEDITERKRVREALNRSESNYRMFVSQSSEGIFCQELGRPIPVDLPEDEQVHRILHDSYMAECNEALARMYGMSPADMAGKRLTGTLAADDPVNIELTRQYIRGGYRVSQRESREIDPQGNPRVFLNSMIGIVENGMLRRTWGIQRDITESKQAEEARRISEERFRLAAHAGKMFAYEWDAATDTVVRSGEYSQIFGTAYGSSITSQELSAMVRPEDRERVSAAIASLSPEKPSLQISYRMVRPDGRMIWVERNSRAHFDEHGKMLRIVGMVTDITERKQTEHALRESEQRLLLAMQAGRMYAFDWDTVSDVIVRSGEYAKILNWTGDASHGTGKDFYARVHPDDHQAYLATERELTPAKPTYRTSFRMLGADGGITWLEEAGQAFFDAQGKMLRVIGMVTNITGRKRVQDELRHKHTDLIEAQRLAQVGSWQWDPKTDNVIWSEQLYRIAGCDPDLPPPTFANLAKFYTDESWERLRHCVGEALRNGTPYELDLEYRPGSTTKWVKARGEALRDARGRIVGLRGTCQDITERKQTEEALASISRRLIDAQEQERARIARDLHDHISQRIALLSIQLDQFRSDLPAPTSEMLSRLDELRMHTSHIAGDVQALAHELHSPKLEYLGIAVAMKSFCKEFSQRQKVETDFTQEGFPRMVPRDISLCLFRVLQESLHNAAKHSGVRRFEVRLRAASDEIELTVHDAGVGFDPQASMNDRGLGLISMEERLQLVNGTFSIESQPNRGTTIRARVPLNSADASMQATG